MSQLNESTSDSEDDLEKAIAEYLERVDEGAAFDVEEWLGRHAPIRGELEEFLETEREFDAAFPSKASNGAGALDETWEMPASSINSPASTPSNPLRSGRSSVSSQIGPYKLSKFLGAGGMGQVYEAVDPNGNLVAVKILSHQWSRSAESLQRFKMEGKIASAINHPRCVFVKAADEDNGLPYIVMELMTGRTLKDLSQESGPMPVNKAIQVIMDVLDGLEEAHTHGMIHRDIKPGNCYLETNGRVKLGDFGLARSVDDSSELTRTGDFVGTPLFASPEQVKGLPIDVRTDIYSVCATLYFLLAGQAPFAGSTPTNVIAKIVSEDPVPLRKLNPQVPVLLERIVMRGLSRDRKSRFQTVAELKQALEPFVRGRHAIAAWGRRFAAFCIDGAINGLLGAIAVQFLPIEDQNAVLPWSVYFSLLLPIFIYHLIFEGIGFASVGKLALRLQIADRVTGERPHRAKVILRTVIVMLLMGFGSDLLIYATMEPKNVFNWMMWQWIGYLVSYSIILAPILFTKRYRLLMHDWLTGTMVIDRPRKSPQQQLAIAASEYNAPLLSASAYPNKIGEFVISGTISSSTDFVVLSASDEKLNRVVWIWLRSPDQPELSQTRRQCDRATRLRWLANGRVDKWQWDAFLAPTGAPLKHWTAPDSPLTWKESRGILRQLATEIEESNWDELPFSINSLDQLWLDSRGRLVLVDWPPSLPPSARQGSTTTHEQIKGILCETARLCLCGKSLPVAGDHPPIHAFVPIHVRELLGKLTSADSGKSTAKHDKELTFSAAQFLEAIDSQSHRPIVPNYENRLLGLGIVITPALLLLGMMFILSRISNNVVLEKITDQLVAPAMVHWMLEGDNGNGLIASSDSNDLPSKAELELWMAEQPSKREELLKSYQKRFAGLNSFSRILAKELKLVEDPAAQLEKISIERSGDKLVAVNWKLEGDRTEFEMATLTRLIRAPKDARPEDLLRRGPLLLTMIAITPYLIWIGWAGITGGGLALWLSGLRIVKSDGAPANWLLRFARPVVAGLPFLLLQSFITCNDLLNPDNLWLSHLAHQLMLWLFLVYAILIVAFPRRAPHDWLLGTHLVTR
ncbi:MAG: protein kinase domain-containing protein [Pirellula sp.]|jgi:uncharacterized RDD family membrane protein YckC